MIRILLRLACVCFDGNDDSLSTTIETFAPLNRKEPFQRRESFQQAKVRRIALSLNVKTKVIV